MLYGFYQNINSEKIDGERKENGRKTAPRQKQIEPEKQTRNNL
jgi:hypothetical protein